MLPNTCDQVYCSDQSHTEMHFVTGGCSLSLASGEEQTALTFCDSGSARTQNTGAVPPGPGLQWVNRALPAPMSLNYVVREDTSHHFSSESLKALLLDFSCTQAGLHPATSHAESEPTFSEPAHQPCSNVHVSTFPSHHLQALTTNT